MIVVYTGETPPESYASAIFLAGPSPRKPGDKNWRSEAIALLEEIGFQGVVFAPVYRDAEKYDETFDYDAQISWETRWLNASDQIVFWVPRDLKELPGFTTNVEFGLWVKMGKALLGSPPDAEKMAYLKWWAEREGVEFFPEMKPLLQRAVEAIGEGEMRTGGERDVPLNLWKKSEFQFWIQSQKAVGNRLDGAELVWNFRNSKDKTVAILWALKVNVWVEGEHRSKTNEVIVFRPDVSAIVAYCRPPKDAGLDWFLDTEILLVREFRSPVATVDGMVHELPGGSAPKDGAGVEVAISELKEETSLSVAPNRIRDHGGRQVAATLCGHRAHLFSVELTPEEMLSMRWLGDTPFGKSEETERTFVEVWTVRDLLIDPRIDWADIGFVTLVLNQFS